MEKEKLQHRRTFSPLPAARHVQRRRCRWMIFRCATTYSTNRFLCDKVKSEEEQEGVEREMGGENDSLGEGSELK